ncbi:DUF3616 domain-containing protein [Rhodoferax sp.]|uniref:DUF3616 domain-containing protein n=1 Tax=Rhodoferax sp. TaxID=50421 RepID=UPI0025EB202A|nr:DUF3616 domain-containing protein [Rhodoferax sp.]
MPPSTPLLQTAAGLLLAVASAQAQTQTAPSIQPHGGVWPVQAGFDFDLGKKKELKTRQSVSGIACSLDTKNQRVCLLAFDEGVEARWATLHDAALVAEPAPLLLRDNTGELDAEGAATDGRNFYVTGSHSAKRNSCESNPHSRHVIRFQRDPATGRALRSADGKLVGYADTGRLWSVMQAQPALQSFAQERACLGADAGVNIEGLAVRDGRLYFGLRSMGAVLAVDADALFSPAAAVQATVTPLVLGAGRGIRDMETVDKGFLLLAGPDDVEAHQGVGWTLAWWDGKPSPTPVTPKVLASLDLGKVKLRDCDKEIKLEALTVLKETPSSYEVLVLSDGMCDGGPLAFTVPK